MSITGFSPADDDEGIPAEDGSDLGIDLDDDGPDVGGDDEDDGPLILEDDEEAEGGPQGEEPEHDQVAELTRARDGAARALSDTRRQLREAEQRAQRIEQRMAPILEEFNARQQQQWQQQQEQQIASTLPDPNEDPVGYITEMQRLQAERLEQRLAQREQHEDQLRQQHQQVEQQRQAFMARDQAARSFAQSVPDYDDALKHAVESRYSEYVEHGWDEQDAVQQAMRDIDTYAWSEFHAGANPGESIYRFARQRGFQSSEGAQGGEDARPMPQPSGRRSRLEERRQQRQGARSLSGATGRGRGRPLTMDQLANASDEEYAQLVRKAGSEERLLQAVAGG